MDSIIGFVPLLGSLIHCKDLLLWPAANFLREVWPFTCFKCTWLTSIEGYTVKLSDKNSVNNPVSGYEEIDSTEFFTQEDTFKRINALMHSLVLYFVRSLFANY